MAFKALQVRFLGALMWTMFQFKVKLSGYNCEDLISSYSETENDDKYKHEENDEFKTVVSFFTAAVAQNKDFEHSVLLLKIQTYWILVVFVAYFNVIKNISQIISKTVKYHEDIIKMWLSSESSRGSTYVHQRYLEFRDEGVADHIKNVTQFKNYVTSEIVSFPTILINILLCVNLKDNSYKLFTQTELVWSNRLKFSETDYSVMECLREQQDQLQYGYFVMCCVCVFTGLVSCINLCCFLKSFYFYLVDTYVYRKTRPIKGLYFHYLLCIYAPLIDGTHIVPFFYEYLLIKFFEDSGYSVSVSYIAGNIYLSRYSAYAESVEM